MDNQCLCCSASDWLSLPEINQIYTVRTDGGIIKMPLAKRHCNNCGFVQRESKYLEKQALVELYQDSYSLYDNRPKAENFETTRYRELSTSITKIAEKTNIQNVLEVGCGNGSLLTEVQKIWSDAQISGVEPANSAVAFAKKMNRNVYQGIIGETLPKDITNRKYDFIYSVHVLEHTSDPVKFLSDLRDMLADNGFIYISCPNGTIPHAELIHPDHLVTMLPDHLKYFAEKAGFKVLDTGEAPTGDSLEFSQYIFAQKTEKKSTPKFTSNINFESLLEKRISYLNSWKMLESDLTNRLNNSSEVLCFGTGGWATLLAAYTPHLWEKIKACVIDGDIDHLFNGKKVINYKDLNQGQDTIFIAGVNPATQPVIKNKLQQDHYNVVTWDDLISY